MKLNMSLDNSMAISIKSRIKLEGSDVTSSQINAVVSTGEVGQNLIVQPVQQTSMMHTYIDQVVY